MSRFITIRLEIPDDVEVRVGGAGTGEDEDEAPLPPPGWATAPPAPVLVGVAGNGANGGSCPVHHMPWRQVPGGVSKRTGRPYSAFWTCPQTGCDQRPR